MKNVLSIAFHFSQKYNHYKEKFIAYFLSSYFINQLIKTDEWTAMGLRFGK